MDGILLIDKPSGWTSFDVVAKVRSILRSLPDSPKKPKVGHTGTLDPFATGLLILTVGKATKVASNYSKLDKEYEATIELGKTSSTGDPEGEITEAGGQKPEIGNIEAVLKQFIGEITQIPPMYSAIKVNGQRAYKLARKGQTVEIEPRNVMVRSIDLLDYSYPYLKIRTHVSSGTYIRTLAEDIGKALGTGAYTTELRRTRVGEADVTDAAPVASLSVENIAQHLKKL
jgi:tRNA pseudouridine55 synthase